MPHLFEMVKEYNMIDYSELINKFEIGKYETRKIAELAKKVNEARNQQMSFATGYGSVQESSKYDEMALQNGLNVEVEEFASILI